jgi:hypothetical protein
MTAVSAMPGVEASRPQGDNMRKVQAIREGKVGPYREILEHIKYDRLTLPLRRLVDTGVIRLDVALMAQDAVNRSLSR